MKKIITVCLLLCVMLAMITTLASCGNKDLIDTEYKYTKAVVLMPDGKVETFEVKSWCDYDQSDMIQFKTPDGKVYLTHSSNVLLIGDD